MCPKFPAEGSKLQASWRHIQSTQICYWAHQEVRDLDDEAGNETITAFSKEFSV